MKIGVKSARRPSRFLAPVVLAALVATVACGPRRESAVVRWQGHAFSEVRSLDDLPDEMQSTLGVRRPGLEGIADRGGAFNQTDVVGGQLPMRRFLTAGKDGDTWLVALERGGRAYNVEVFLFSERQAASPQEWVLSDRPQTLSEVVRQLSEQKVQ